MFLHRLALGLGSTVGELERRLGTGELSDWMLYWRREPWGPLAANLNAALIASTVANVFRGGGARAYSPQDLIIGERRAVDPDDLASEWVSALETIGLERQRKRKVKVHG